MKATTPDPSSLCFCEGKPTGLPTEDHQLVVATPEAGDLLRRLRELPIADQHVATANPNRRAPKAGKYQIEIVNTSEIGYINALN